MAYLSKFDPAGLDKLTKRTTMSSTTTAPTNQWTRPNMTEDLDMAPLSPYTFRTLLLEVAHNLRDEDLSPETIRAHYKAALMDAMRDARDVLDGAMPDIYVAALADRQTDLDDPQDDMGEQYRANLPDALRVVVGDDGSRTIVGPAGYLKMRNEALRNGQDLLPWTELEKHPNE